MSREYFIPSKDSESEYTEKRSRFIGQLKYVETEAEAREFIALVKKKHYDARHNCWCYIIKDGAERYSDDGEPQGTAGIPMLEVFRKENMVNVVCVVTRYFGGILLGAGGLLRAYTKAASDTLKTAGKTKLQALSRFNVICSYSMAEKIKTLILANGGNTDNIEYGSDVKITVSVGESGAENLKAKLVDASGGNIKIDLFTKI